ncbi:hypothetical protein N0V83_004325 [Neocucurbitaria cava]|uniref:Uncharacterized protein n=1 Tax=Neocucurbitaria cava TaxID=798079 RepID=A0A9W8Y8X6_9PLEO|nr:hypothetical protein N0V83_004325 [Neocucurbitaria cava]
MSAYVPGTYGVFWTNARTADLAALPPYLQAEFLRIWKLGWLTGPKNFESPWDFYMGHYLLLNSVLWHHFGGGFNVPDSMVAALRTRLDFDDDGRFGIDTNVGDLVPSKERWPDPLLPYHGLEKVRLDFDAEQYFALFNVAVPPFNYQDNGVHGDNLYPDPFCHGAAALLLHTKDLTLHFGTAYKSAHPWYNVGEEKWCTSPTTTTAAPSSSLPGVIVEGEETVEPRLRPHVCVSGKVADWILEYAWHHRFLQHIPHIRITGDVQPWVREKWHAIFAAQAEHNKQVLAATSTATPATPATATPAPVGVLQRNTLLQPFAVHRPDIRAIEGIGKVRRNDDDDEDPADPADQPEWKPERYYPPKCECEIGCWRLVGGKVLEETREKSWEEMQEEQGEEGVEVVGNWDDGREEVRGVW